MDESQVKVLLQEDDFVETLWAERIGANVYRLENSPFWAYGVSWMDVVEAYPDPNGQLRMTRVMAKAGHRTIRIILEADVAGSANGQAILDGVGELGASYEGMNPTYLAIDIPPDADLMAVARYFTDRGVRWEHADPRYSELYPEEG